MKKLLNSLPQFTRIERMGFTALSVLIALFFIAWQTIPYIVPAPEINTAEDRKMALAWEQYKAAHLMPEEATSGGAIAVSTIPVQLAPFDPNILDSTGFLRLGLSPRVVKGLMNWRRHGKVFYKKEDLQPLYNLTEADYTRIEPYITITATRNPYGPRTFGNSWAKLPPLPPTLDLNTTDSATIVRLNGIGPTLAHKIIVRRAALGGYLKHEQLLEVYKFNDTTFSMLREKLVIHPEKIKKLGINTATLEQLQAHPYIGEKMAKNILLLRNGMKRFDQIQQLRQVPLMNEEIYRKIAPYLMVD